MQGPGRPDIVNTRSGESGYSECRVGGRGKEREGRGERREGAERERGGRRQRERGW
ncbi:unnamed protein product, partial [Staurois parvus]